MRINGSWLLDDLRAWAAFVSATTNTVVIVEITNPAQGEVTVRGWP